MTNDLTYYGLKDLKNLTELPKHISFRQKEELKIAVEQFFKPRNKKNKITKKHNFLIQRDKLFIEFLWHTGGRVKDICQLRLSNIDKQNRILKLFIHKNDKILDIPLDSGLILDLTEFCSKYNTDTPFKMTSANAWCSIKKYGNLINLRLHPHMFRHGLALFMLEKGIPIPYITARLGHSSPIITMKMYLKITPEIQKKILPLLSGDINDR